MLLFLLGGAQLWLGGAQLWALDAGKPLQEFGEQIWGSEAGLPQNTVHGIVQTGDGFLWIATEGGLVRFDGTEFRVFDTANTPALHSDLIQTLIRDNAGLLWAGTPEGLVCVRGELFAAYGAGQGLPSADVLSLFSSRAGELLAETPGGAALLQGGRFKAIAGTEQLGFAEGASFAAESADGTVALAGSRGVMAFRSLAGAGRRLTVPEVGAIQAIAPAPDGRLWVGGASGLAVVGPGGSRRFSPGDGLPGSDVTGLVAAPDGRVWIGTSDGLASFAGGVIRSVRELAGVRIGSLFLDREQALWVAGDSVFRVTGSKVEPNARRPSLAGVLTTFEDREGSMWFGTETAGLAVLRQQAFFTLGTADGLSAGLVRAVFEDGAGTVWLGTSGGGLDRVRAGEVAPFAGKLPSRVVLALAEAEGSLWVGTPEGLVRVRGSETRVFTTADGLADDFVRSLYADRDGSLWIGTRNGLSHWQGGGFRSYSTLDGLPSDLIGAMLRRKDGELWVGTLGGLSRMTGDGFVAAGGSASATTALLEDAQGALWVGTNGTGLSCLRGNRWTAFPPAKTGLPATIYGMLEDGGGNLWLSSRTGVDRVGIAALGREAAGSPGPLAVQHYGTADGMRIREASGGGHPAAWRAHDGALWFATLNGAAIVHPSAQLRNTVPPLTVIEAVSVDDRPAVARGAAIQVPAGRGRFAIAYAGLSFVAPTKVRYRYLLEGFDKAWVDAGTRRTAFYTNVPPGRYRFLVMSANNDGVWSLRPAEAGFTVAPFFYQTAWFYGLLALLLGGSGYAVYGWRVRTVRAQYRAVLAERGRIAREIHDTLAQGYVAISVQIELAERLLASSAEAAAEQLRQTKALVREGLDEARSSIWDLRTESGTLPALLAHQLRQPAHSATTVKFMVHGSYRPLARSFEKEILRIAGEAVANALAHAKASLVSVALSYDADSLLLRVQDDGVGFEPGAVPISERGHFGLQGMQERAARIHAMLDIRAREPGTVVTLRLDLRRAGRKGPG